MDKGLRERLEHVASSDFGRVSYTEAVDLLKKSGEKFDYPVEWGIDLQTEHERYLTEHIFKRPVFVTDYPKDIKAFYMRLNDDGKTVAAADCLVPGIGEIIGGSQREERLDVLEARIQELGMNPEDYRYYCDLRRYGSCRHAGYRPGLRADGDVSHRCEQHPRRGAASPHCGQRRFLINCIPKSGPSEKRDRFFLPYAQISLENLKYFRHSTMRGQLTFRGAYDRIRLSSTTEYRQWKPIGKRRKSTEGVKLSGVRRADRTMGGCGSGESQFTGYRR